MLAVRLRLLANRARPAGYSKTRSKMGPSKMGFASRNLIIHPATMKELGADFEDALAALRYGCIAVNTWTGVGFLLAQSTWGAFPGHARARVRADELHSNRG